MKNNTYNYKTLAIFKRQISEMIGIDTEIQDLEKFDLVSENELETLILTIYDNIDNVFGDSKFQALKKDLLWNTTLSFSKCLDITRKNLSDVIYEMRISEKEQDGDSVKSEQLEELTKLAEYYTEQEQILEQIFELAKYQYFKKSGGFSFQLSKKDIYTKHIQTAAILDSQTFRNNKEKSDVLAKAPQGSIVAIAGGNGYNYPNLSKYLDKLKNKLPDLILLTCGNTNKNSLDYAVRQWAKLNKVNIIIEHMKSNYTKDKSTGFKRNEQLLKFPDLKGLIFIETETTSGLMLNLLQKAQEKIKTDKAFKIHYQADEKTTEKNNTTKQEKLAKNKNKNKLVRSVKSKA